MAVTPATLTHASPGLTVGTMTTAQIAQGLDRLVIQQFVIPQVAEVSFTMTNVRTGRMATSTGNDSPITQSPGNGSNVLWTIRHQSFDNEQAGNPIITYAELPPTHACEWKLEAVTASSPTTAPQEGRMGRWARAGMSLGLSALVTLFPPWPCGYAIPVIALVRGWSRLPFGAPSLTVT